MIVIDNLDFVAKSSTTKSVKPVWGRQLAARRAEIGMSLTDVANATDGVVYPQLLYRLENGRTEPKNLKASQLQALLHAIDWEMGHWLELTHQTDPHDSSQGTAVERTSISPVGSREIPVYDLVSAGPGGEGGTIVDTASIPDEWRGDFTAYQVTGDSMSPSIPDGATIIVRKQDHANVRQIVVCYAPGHGTVVKVLSGIIDGDTYVLTSLNPNYAPIVTQGVRIFGIIHKIWNDPPVIDGNGHPKASKLN